MGILDEFKRLAHPYEDEDEEDFEDEFDVPPRPAERRERSRNAEPAYSGSAMEESERRSNKVVNIRAATQLQVVLVKPEKFEDASAIADHLRETRRGLRQRGQDQKSGHLHLHHHPLQRGHPGGPDRRAGEQRPVFLKRDCGPSRLKKQAA